MLLTPVDYADIREGYQIQIYDWCVAQCIQFFVIVHEKTSSTSAQLEQIAIRYLKEWLEENRFGA